MNINLRNMGFVKFNNQIVDWVKFNGQLVYEAFKKLLVSGIPPLTLTKSKGVDLVDYKIYGNSLQDGTPTPEVPVEIESVGEKTVNMFDEEEFFRKACELETLAAYEPVYETIDGRKGLKLYGRTCGLGSVNDGTRLGFYNIFKENTQYTISFDYYDVKAMTSSGYESFGPLIYCYYTDGTADYNLFPSDTKIREPGKWLHQTFTSAAGKTILRINTSYGTGLAHTYFDNFQIEESSLETPYEPYGYKIPIISRSNNLLNADGLDYFTKNDDGEYVYTGGGAGLSARVVMTGFKENTRYSVRITIKSPVGCNYRPVIKYTDGTQTDMWANSTGDYVTIFRFTTVNKMIDRIEWGYSKNSTDVVFKDFQVVEGVYTEDEMPDYEPYAKTRTNIYLAEPLRKIGDYKDYIDFESKEAIRNIKNTDITSLSWSKYSTYNTYYSMTFTDAKYDFDVYCLSDKYIGSESGGGTSYGSGYIWFQNSSTYPRLYIADDRFADLDSFREYLSNLIEEGNPINLSYVLNTPIHESVNLPTLPTIKGTTIIEVDTSVQPSNMAVTYLGKQS